MREPLRYGEAYAEEVVLGDGRRVRLRLVRPADRELLRRGFDRLSPESRYRRFFTPKPRLTEAELDYFTRCDNDHHLAIGAVGLDGEGREEGLGVARFVRFLDDPGTAEAAVTVVDDAHHLGLGRVLLSRLIDAAQERGVERFLFLVLAGNRPIRELLHGLAPHAVEHSEGREIAIEIALPVPPDGAPAQAAPSALPADHPLYTLLRHAATGAVEVITTLPRRTPSEVYTVMREAAAGALETLARNVRERVPPLPRLALPPAADPAHPDELPLGVPTRLATLLPATGPGVRGRVLVASAGGRATIVALAAGERFGTPPIAGTVLVAVLAGRIEVGREDGAEAPVVAAGEVVRLGPGSALWFRAPEPARLLVATWEG